MAIRLADTTKPMGDFPVAEGVDIDVNVNGKTKRLQKAIEDGDIGGGNQIQFDILPIASAELLGKVYQFIGDTGTYSKGSFYECIEKDGSYLWDKLSADTPVTLTEAQWEALDKSTLKDGQQINIKDDSEASIINDDKTTVDNTWSAKKISDSLVDKNEFIKLDTTKTDANDCVPTEDNVAKSYRVGNDALNIPYQESGIIETFVFRRDGNTRITQKYTVNFTQNGSPTFVRTGVNSGNAIQWSAWSQLATMDKVATDERISFVSLTSADVGTTIDIPNGCKKIAFAPRTENSALAIQPTTVFMSWITSTQTYKCAYTDGTSNAQVVVKVDSSAKKITFVSQSGNININNVLVNFLA